MAFTCERCEDQGWVCENHKDRPWNVDGPRNCECGAGAPCPDCNASTGRDDPPRMPPGFRVIDKGFDEAALDDGFLDYVLHEIEAKGSFVPGSAYPIGDPYNGRAAYEERFAGLEAYQAKCQAASGQNLS